jgi:hypothetical protein
MGLSSPNEPDGQRPAERSAAGRSAAERAATDEGAAAGTRRAAILALGATLGFYAALILGFLAMVWTLFQILIWIFTG